MVSYLFIGIIVAIVETVYALVDLKKLGLTIYDVYPELKQKNRGFTVCVLSSVPVVLTIMWPWQVYHWIKKAVTRT